MPLSPAEFVRGAVETAEEGGEWTFRRFAPGQAAAYREAGNDDFYQKTFASAGVRLALRTDAEALSFDYRFERGSSRAFGFFDVYVDGALAAHGGLEADDGARHAFAAELGPGEKRVEIYLPWSRRTFVSNFALRRASFAEPLRRTRTMLCFGDSITQGWEGGGREVLDRLSKTYRILDLGCGSGILSIAALLLGAESASAVDIDANSVKIAKENAEKNHIEAKRYNAVCGNVIDDEALRKSLGTGYDMVCANIVADVLLAMAPLFSGFLKAGAKLIISGIIDSRKDEVIDAVKAQGFELCEIKTLEDWTAAAFINRN